MAVLKQKRVLPRSTDGINKAREHESQETLPGKSNSDTSNNLVALQRLEQLHAKANGTDQPPQQSLLYTD